MESYGLLSMDSGGILGLGWNPWIRSFHESAVTEPVDMRDLEHDEFSQRCPICMETFGYGRNTSQAEQPSRLPCGHVFGTTCATMWFMENNTCGYCRHNFWAELGSPTPPSHQPENDPGNFALDLEDYSFWNQDEEMPDIEDSPEEMIQERQQGREQSLAPWNLFQSQELPDEMELEYVHSNTNNDELEPIIDFDRNAFMSWGMASVEDLGVEEDFDEHEIMRYLDEDQGIVIEDQGEWRMFIDDG